MQLQAQNINQHPKNPLKCQVCRHTLKQQVLKFFAARDVQEIKFIAASVGVAQIGFAHSLATLPAVNQSVTARKYRHNIATAIAVYSYSQNNQNTISSDSALQSSYNKSDLPQPQSSLQNSEKSILLLLQLAQCHISMSTTSTERFCHGR